MCLEGDGISEKRTGEMARWWEHVVLREHLLRTQEYRRRRGGAVAQALRSWSSEQVENKLKSLNLKITAVGQSIYL